MPLRGTKTEEEYHVPIVPLRGMKANEVISQAHEGLGRIPRPLAGPRLVGLNQVFPGHRSQRFDKYRRKV